MQRLFHSRILLTAVQQAWLMCIVRSGLQLKALVRAPSLAICQYQGVFLYD